MCERKLLSSSTQPPDVAARRAPQCPRGRCGLAAPRAPRPPHQDAGMCAILAPAVSLGS